MESAHASRLNQSAVYCALVCGMQRKKNFKRIGDSPPIEMWELHVMEKEKRWSEHALVCDMSPLVKMAHMVWHQETLSYHLPDRLPSTSTLCRLVELEGECTCPKVLLKKKGVELAIVIRVSWRRRLRIVEEEEEQTLMVWRSKRKRRTMFRFRYPNISPWFDIEHSSTNMLGGSTKRNSTENNRSSSRSLDSR